LQKTQRKVEEKEGTEYNILKEEN